MPPVEVKKRWQDNSLDLQQLIWRAMDTRMDNADRLRYRTCTSRPRPPETNDPIIAARARAIPQLLWRGWSARLLPSAGIRNTTKFRASLAAALLLPGWSQRRFEPVIKLLHQDPRFSLYYELAKLAQLGHDGIFTAVCEIAEFLDRNPIPIDYQRRREIVGTDLVPNDAWLAICARSDVLPGQHKRLLLVRRYLYQRITGSDLQQAPGFLRIQSPAETAAIAEVPFRITAPLLQALDDYADGYLKTLGIHEPVVWEPPFSLTTQSALPGRLVDAAQARQLICHDDLAPSSAATQLNATVEALRHCFEEHPPHAPWPSNGRGAWTDDTALGTPLWDG